MFLVINIPGCFIICLSGNQLDDERSQKNHKVGFYLFHILYNFFVKGNRMVFTISNT